MISLGIADLVSLPEPVKLPNGTTVVMGRWVLNSAEAEALDRPVGSIERNLRVIRNEGGVHSESATSPRASWYLVGLDYLRLMEIIRAGQGDFDTVKSLVDEVKSADDVGGVRSYIATHNSRN